MTMPETVIALSPGTDRDRAEYGVTHRSTFVYRIRSGAAGQVHNRSFPHRIVVWDNTVRPNDDPDFRSEWIGRRGPGRYVAPDGHGTDAPVSVLTSAESIGIDDSRTGTGSEASGQVWADDTLTIGDTVTLAWPDGATGRFRVTARGLADPVLLPL